MKIKSITLSLVLVASCLAYGQPQKPKVEKSPPAAINVAALSSSGHGTDWDPWVGWDHAINAEAADDLTLNFSRGIYLQKEVLKIRPGWIVAGPGHRRTVIRSDVANPFSVLAAINSRSDYDCRITGLTIANHAAKDGAGINVVGASAVEIDHVCITGFDVEIVLDQAENAHVHHCKIWALTGRAGIWIANGPLHTPGAAGEYDNNITIDENQFAGETTSIGIIDDGGDRHSIERNDFAGLLHAITFAATRCGNFIGNYCEGQQAEIISLQHYSPLDPAQAELSNSFSLNIQNNFFSAAGHPVIDGTCGAVSLQFTGNDCYGVPAAAFIMGPGRFWQLQTRANRGTGTKPLVEGESDNPGWIYAERD